MVIEIALMIVSVVGVFYGLLGLRLVFGKAFARRTGDTFRRFYGVQSSGEVGEQIYDRLTRGVPAAMLGFGLAFICIRALLT